MAVLLNTSLGNIVVDLYAELCPLTAKNFLKLCKIKYYNNCLFHSVQKDFLVQTGDPTGTGSGGDSIYKFLYGEQARFFNDEIHLSLKHDKVGVVAMASAGENLNASQFYITTRADLDYLDGKHTVFGLVAEGEDVLMKINEAFVDGSYRPFKNIRIKHTYILDDPFEDPVQLAELIPDSSPLLPPPQKGEEVRLEDDWVPLDEQMDPEELDKSLRQKEAHSRAVVLEMIGDIPDAEVTPPENVLFVCKLNPVTQDEDLETIFSRFGKIISADIIRDYKTGDSLCYAFIEFEAQEACEAAYFKMDNVLIDDRRIHVDFSQSVSRLWTRYRRFGKRDADDGKGSSFAPRANDKDCFKCGASGHFAKDCPGMEEERPHERHTYEFRNTESQQRGGGTKKYDMVFEDTHEADEKRERRETKSLKQEERGRSYTSHATARQEEEDNHRSRSSHHQSTESKRYRESTDVVENRSQGSKKYRRLDTEGSRDSSHYERHAERKESFDATRSGRTKSHHDGHEIGSDRYSDWKGKPNEEKYRDHHNRHEPESDRNSHREKLAEEHHRSRHNILSKETKNRDRDRVQEDYRSHSRKDQYNRNDSSDSQKWRREGSPRGGHSRDMEKNRDRYRK